MKVPVYNMKGEQMKEIDLSDVAFAGKTSPTTVHQVVVALQSNLRLSTAHTKTRGEVRGGGKKPWKQKGTGRARHGSTRSPIWRKGGVVFGPLKERNHEKEVTKAMRKVALRSVLIEKVAQKSMVVVDAFSSFSKTKDLVARFSDFKMSVPAFENIKDKKFIKKPNQALFLTVVNNVDLVRSSRNVSFIKVEEARNANVLDLLKYRVCLVEEKAIPVLQKLVLK